jgi:putative endonuclease
MTGWVYILRCSDNSYYVGSTNNLELRISQHQEGLGSQYTRNRLPVELIYTEEFQTVAEAFYREKQIQGWSKCKREALIKGLFDQLKVFSECQNDTSSKLQKDSDTSKVKPHGD